MPKLCFLLHLPIEMQVFSPSFCSNKEETFLRWKFSFKTFPRLFFLKNILPGRPSLMGSGSLTILFPLSPSRIPTFYLQCYVLSRNWMHQVWKLRKWPFVVEWKNWTIKKSLPKMKSSNIRLYIRKSTYYFFLCSCTTQMRNTLYLILNWFCNSIVSRTRDLIWLSMGSAVLYVKDISYHSQK